MDTELFDLITSFILTWAVVLIPPIAVRGLRRRPLARWTSATFALVQYVLNVTLFSALGSTSKGHLALTVGAYFSYRILTGHTNRSAAKVVAEQRKALGYD